MLKGEYNVSLMKTNHDKTPYTYVGLQVKCVFFQSHFNQNGDVLKNFS